MNADEARDELRWWRDEVERLIRGLAQLNALKERAHRDPEWVVRFARENILFVPGVPVLWVEEWDVEADEWDRLVAYYVELVVDHYADLIAEYERLLVVARSKAVVWRRHAGRCSWAAQVRQRRPLIVTRAHRERGRRHGRRRARRVTQARPRPDDPEPVAAPAAEGAA